MTVGKVITATTPIIPRVIKTSARVKANFFITLLSFVLILAQFVLNLALKYLECKIKSTKIKFCFKKS